MRFNCRLIIALKFFDLNEINRYDELLLKKLLRMNEECRIESKLLVCLLNLQVLLITLEQAISTILDSLYFNVYATVAHVF